MSNRKRYNEMIFEIGFYESILESAPDFVEALVCLGDLYTKTGRIAEGLAVDQRLAALRPDDPYVFYNLACSYSLSGQIERAIEAVRMAIEKGYTDFDYLLKDSDLSQLLANGSFREYLQRLRRQRAASSGITDPASP
ncbi:MAG: TPR end-of-group domain-containing protein [Candidatus Omnitrophota bacterium]